jgi:hypothetical protein
MKCDNVQAQNERSICSLSLEHINTKTSFLKFFVLKEEGASTLNQIVKTKLNKYKSNDYVIMILY